MIKIQVIHDSTFQEEILNEEELDKNQVIARLSKFPTKLKISFEKTDVFS